MYPFLVLLMLLTPLVDIYVLIKVGAIIGALPTIFWVVFTAVLGVGLVRLQGFTTLARLRATVMQGGIPAMELMEGVVLMLAGGLLLLPGFITDAVGLCLFIPPLRRALIAWTLRRFFPPFGGPQAPGGERQDRGPRTIEGEFRREDE